MSPKQDEFYIGWQENAPSSYRRAQRRSWIFLLVLAPISALMVVLGQQAFNDSTFEFGQTTELNGVLTYHPVPMLQVSQADTLQSIILIGYGKIGAEPTLQGMEKEAGHTLDGHSVSLAGTRIFHDGKMALELTQGPESLVAIGNRSNPIRHTAQLGPQRLKGEILDPKCALGVMIPANGKSHRSCAVRCISGGIPPILRLSSSQGKHQYALLLGKNGESINPALLPYVGDQVAICGELSQENDWLIFKTDPSKDITRINLGDTGSSISLCSRE